MKILRSIIAMLGMLILAFSLVYFRDYLSNNASSPLAAFWLLTLASLLFTAAILAFAWFVLVRSEPDKVSAIIYLVLGLAIQVLTPSMITFKVEPMSGILGQLLFYMPDSFYGLSGSFVAGIGLINLLHKPEKPAEDLPEKT